MLLEIITMRSEIAHKYINENFTPEDRIAVVLLNKRTEQAVQRIAVAARIVSPEFQAWLRHMNAQRYEVYVSMNPLKAGASGRTREDVDHVQHIYLDLDENGTAAVASLLKREDLPQPNYLVNSSPDKWQVVWRVEGFEKEQAEQLQRGLARDAGADPAAVDVARVLRLPGFFNHKYGHPYFVTVEEHSAALSRPEQFPTFSDEERSARSLVNHRGDLHDPMQLASPLSQSELDWASVRNALRQGKPPNDLIAELAARRTDKPNPRYYAEHAVKKAVDSFGLHAELHTRDGRG
jgi:hypothetical protein